MLTHNFKEMLNVFRASRALLEEFEDEKELPISENGLLLLQLVKVSLTLIFSTSILNKSKTSTVVLLKSRNSSSASLVAKSDVSVWLFHACLLTTVCRSIIHAL